MAPSQYIFTLPCRNNFFHVKWNFQNVRVFIFISSIFLYGKTIHNYELKAVLDNNQHKKNWFGEFCAGNKTVSGGNHEKNPENNFEIKKSLMLRLKTVYSAIPFYLNE